MINTAVFKERGVRPRVHGNGFIQVDLTDDTRLHVWGDKRIPRQQVYTPIHDHVYGFESTIIVGRLFSIVYSVYDAPYGDYRVYRPESNILRATCERVNIEAVHTDIIEWGTSNTRYTISPFDFHETFVTEPTATIIKKTDPIQARGIPIKPRVLVRYDQKPDNDFNRHDYDDDLLWRIVERVLKRRTR